MPCIVKHSEGPVSVAAAGAYDFFYKHPTDKPPTMIDLITGELITGTGAKATIYFIDGADVYHRISVQQLTPETPMAVYSAPFLLVSGEKIKLRISGLAAADTVQWSVNGH